MEIPTFQNIPYVDEDSYLTSQARMYNDTLNNVLRNGLSDNGWTLPTVTAAQLTEIVAMTPTPIDGTIWYVSDASPPTLVVQMAGALYKISTTTYP
jgi:hypothetical protein